MLMERQLPHDSVLAIGEPETDFRGLLERVTKHLWSPHLKMTNQGFFTMLRNINDSAIVPPRHQPVGSGEIVGEAAGLPRAFAEAQAVIGRGHAGGDQP